MKKLVIGMVGVMAMACGSQTTTEDGVSGSELITACTAATQPSVWASAFSQPLKPPRFAAGLDLAVTDDFQTITQDGTQQALCAGTLIPDEDPASTEVSYSWGEGDLAPLSASFDKVSHKMTAVQFGTGYTGSIDFKSRPASAFGQHTYTAKVGGTIMRDGAAFVINWADEAARDKSATELFDALVFTFGPNLPGETVNCRTSQHCLVTKLETGEAIFGARDVHFYFHFAPGATPDAAPTDKADYFYMLPMALGYTPPPPPPNP